jgi:murein L,D-transpeptidase YafK
MTKFFLVTLIAAAVASALAWANWPAAPLPPGSTADRILVEKAARTLTLFHGDRVLKKYSVSLGRVPVGPKQREGDKKTPEGVYHIQLHKFDSSYHRALQVSYPAAEDVARAKLQGVSAGLEIMVHGAPNGWGLIGRAHRAADWTAGCIAVTNPEIEEIYAAVPDGTVIEIRK